MAMMAFFEKVVMMKIRDGRLEKDLKKESVDLEKDVKNSITPVVYTVR